MTPGFVTWSVTAVVLAGFLIEAPSAGAQPVEPGIREAGSGGAGTARRSALWMDPNPARIAGLRVPRLEAFASQGFGLSELRLLALGTAVPVGPHVLGAEVRTFGFELFREVDGRVGIAHSFSGARSVGIGISASAGQTRIPGYADHRAWGFAAGAWTELGPGWTVGLSGTWPADRSGLGRGRRPRVRSGLAVELGPNAHLLLDVEARERRDACLRTGLSWQPVRGFRLRSGWSSRPVSLTLGMSLQVGSLRSGWAARSHPVLGWTPAVALGYEGPGASPSEAHSAERPGSATLPSDAPARPPKSPSDSPAGTPPGADHER